MEADNEILRDPGELSGQISPGRSALDTITWDSRLPSDAIVVRGRELKLPQIMKGKLTPEEWRPLLGIVAGALRAVAKAAD